MLAMNRDGLLSPHSHYKQRYGRQKNMTKIIWSLLMEGGLNSETLWRLEVFKTTRDLFEDFIWVF